MPQPDEAERILLQVMLPEATGQSRDVAGASVGVSGSSIDKAVKILAEAPDIAAAVSSGGRMLRPAIQSDTQITLEVNIDFHRQKEVKWWSRSLPSSVRWPHGCSGRWS